MTSGSAREDISFIIRHWLYPRPNNEIVNKELMNQIQVGPAIERMINGDSGCANNISSLYLITLSATASLGDLETNTLAEQ